MPNISTQDRELEWIAARITHDAVPTAYFHIVHEGQLVATFDSVMMTLEGREQRVRITDIPETYRQGAESWPMLRNLIHGQIDEIVTNHVSGLLGRQRYQLLAWRTGAQTYHAQYALNRQGQADPASSMTLQHGFGIAMQGVQSAHKLSQEAFAHILDERAAEIAAVREEAKDLRESLEQQLKEARAENKELRVAWVDATKLGQKLLDESARRALELEEARLRMQVRQKFGEHVTEFTGLLAERAKFGLRLVADNTVPANGARVPELREFFLKAAGAKDFVSEDAGMAFLLKVGGAIKMAGLTDEQVTELGRILIVCVATKEELAQLQGEAA